MDGTLALLGGRSPYSLKVSSDKPNLPVIQVVQALANDPRVDAIIIVSGRDARARPATAAWLAAHEVPYTELIMRPTGDNRPDQVLKQEILHQRILPRYEVTGVLDDRNKVVKMWRDNGLVCLQVAEGDF